MNKLKKHITSIILIACLVLLVSCKSISKEEAVSITQDIVNNQVKFYVNEDNETPVVEQADITIYDTVKKDNRWNIYLRITSNQTGTIKKSDLLVVLDAKTGGLIDMEKITT